MKEKKYCLGRPNECEDKNICCFYCKKKDKCKLSPCLDDANKCKLTATEEEWKELLPVNHLNDPIEPKYKWVNKKLKEQKEFEKSYSKYLKKNKEEN